MRLSFANGEHADFIVDSGTVSMGSADGNAVVLPGRDVAARHARLTVDARGIVLDVLDAAAQTHVNARPIRERALLRCGDILCVGRVAITLKADRDDLIRTVLPGPAAPVAATAVPPPARVILRGMSGSHFGKAVAIAQRLVIGRDGNCGLVIDEARIAPRHAQIETGENLICLRGLEGSGGACVNGIPVRDAILHPGDQLTFGRSQFVVEAPGFPLRDDAAGHARAITEPFEAVSAGGGKDASRSGQGGLWWLIGAAAMIALALALLIHRGV